MPKGRLVFSLITSLILVTPTVAPAQGGSPEERARQIEAQMTDDERFAMIISLSGATRFTGGVRDKRYPNDAPLTAGYTSGVPRLGVPALLSTDASMGVTNPGFRPDDKGATAMPASALVGATFNPRLAREGGAAIAREARSRGFNIQLAGGINLSRDLRNGRTYEYYSEDPWLSAVMGAEAVNGIQSEGVISTLKHFHEARRRSSRTRARPRSARTGSARWPGATRSSSSSGAYLSIRRLAPPSRSRCRSETGRTG